MKAVEYSLSAIFVLILVYLFLSAPGAVGNIFKSLSTYGSAAIGTLQGRTVNFGQGAPSIAGSTLSGGIGSTSSVLGY